MIVQIDVAWPGELVWVGDAAAGSIAATSTSSALFGFRGG